VDISPRGEATALTNYKRLINLYTVSQT